MKSFKFKLEALLKMRRFKEDECKRQIGLLQNQIQMKKDLMQQHEENIDEAYLSQEKVLENGVDGEELRFYPYFVDGNRQSILALKKSILGLEHQVKLKLAELAKLRGDVKVIEKMKEEQRIKYKREIEKKKQNQLEEEVSQWILRKN